VQRLEVLVAVMLARERRIPADAEAGGCTALPAALATLPSGVLEIVANAVAALPCGLTNTYHSFRLCKLDGRLQEVPFGGVRKVTTGITGLWHDSFGNFIGLSTGGWGSAGSKSYAAAGSLSAAGTSSLYESLFDPD
jgi:hypothetical protein